jgi:hypothetical protein
MDALAAYASSDEESDQPTTAPTSAPRHAAKKQKVSVNLFDDDFLPPAKPKSTPPAFKAPKITAAPAIHDVSHTSNHHSYHVDAQTTTTTVSLDSEARAKLGLSRHAQNDSNNPVKFTEIQQQDQMMDKTSRESAKLPAASIPDNAVFRKRHNIRWLSQQAVALDEVIEDRTADARRKRKDQAGKYGF